MLLEVRADQLIPHMNNIVEVITINYLYDQVWKLNFDSTRYMGEWDLKNVTKNLTISTHWEYLTLT